MSDETPSPPDPSTNGAGPSRNGVDSLPVLDPATAPSVQLAVRARCGLVGPIEDRSSLSWPSGGCCSGPTSRTTRSSPSTPPSTCSSPRFGGSRHSIGLEFLRQIHYLIAERSPRWYRLWSLGIFALPSKLFRKSSDWTRFRMGRAVRILFVLFILALLLGALFHVSPAVSLFLVPSALFVALPLHRRSSPSAFFFVIFQFVGIFWFMSRGGVDVYYPGDVKTRFSDVWGQDAVVERVKENIIFLKDPEAIEKPRRLRPRRHPALGSAGNRQDPDRRGGRRRDREPLRLRRPGCVHQHVHGRRHLEGEEPVPKAPQARPPLRRRRRLLRRGGLARQPWCRSARRASSGPRLKRDRAGPTITATA